MRRRGWVPLVWLVSLVACAIIAARTRYPTNMGDFLPHSASMAQQVLAGQVNGAAASHIVMLDIKGAPAPVLARLSQALAAQLRPQPDFINVMNGDAKSFAGVQNYVWRNRYLLSPGVTAQRFSTAGLHAALQNDLSLLSSELGTVMGESLRADPTGETLGLLSQFGNGGGPAMQNGAWMTANGNAALLLVDTAAPGFDLDAQQRALARIKSRFSHARAAIPAAAGAYLQMSGPGVFAVHIRNTTKSDVTRLSILALSGAATLLIFAYRSPLVLLLGLLPIAAGALAAIAAVSLAFGFVHGITLGFGVTLIGESLDYAIYLFTQTARGEPADAALARIWPTLRLGALTSIVGFSAMLASSFTGFAQLGLFSIAGLAAALGTTRFVLPLLVPQSFFAAGAEPLGRPVQALIAHRRAGRGVVALGVAAAFIALLAHQSGMWDQNLLNLSPIPQAAQQLNQNLQRELGVPNLSFFAVFKASSAQRALQQSEALAPVLVRLVAAQELGGFNLPSNILPSDATQRQRQADLPDIATLKKRFSQAARGLPFKISAFTPFFSAVAAARTAPLLTPSSLPPALRLQFGSMLVRHGAAWVVVAPLHDVTHPAAVTRALTAGGAHFVDLNQASTRLLHTFQNQAVTLAVVGSVAIFGVTPAYQTVQDYRFIAGEPLSEPDINERRFVVVLGYDIGPRFIEIFQKAGKPGVDTVAPRHRFHVELMRLTGERHGGAVADRVQSRPTRSRVFPQEAAHVLNAKEPLKQYH